MEATVTLKLTTTELNTLRRAVKALEVNCAELHKDAKGSERESLAKDIIDSQRLATVLG